MTRLPPLDPAVAATRVAVREVLGGVAAGAGASGAERGEDHPLVLVALSGGADSLALAAAVAFEAPRARVRPGAIVVDHGLQPGSAQTAARAAGQARALGLDPVLVRRVEVEGAASSAVGPEAAARTARYEAFEAAVDETGAAALLTAHTRDDQAEQVLLALARGSGTRAIAGIPPRRGAILRPFLSVSRETTEAACRAQQLEPWRDPHNADPAFTRVRVRERVLPVLEAELGTGVSAGLARSAELAREDADALDAMALRLLHEMTASEGDELGLPILVLRSHPPALRNRIIRLAARERFGSHLSREHTLAIAALVTDWRGQGPIDVPGIEASREGERLLLRRR